MGLAISVMLSSSLIDSLSVRRLTFLCEYLHTIDCLNIQEIRLNDISLDWLFHLELVFRSCCSSQVAMDI